MTAEASGTAGAHAERRNTYLLYLIAALTTTSQGALELIFPLNLARLDHPLSLVGATVALLGVGSLASRIPAGAWYRTPRARTLTASSLAAFGVTTIGLALGDQWALQAALAAIHGFAFGLATTFLLALLVEVQPPHAHVAPTIAWYTAAISTGYAAGALVGARAIAWLDYPGAFVASSAVGMVGAGLAWLLRPPPAEERPAAPVTARPGLALADGLRLLAHLPTGVWLATLLAFYLNFVRDTYDTFFPIYAVGAGVSLGAIGFLKSLHSLSAAVVRFAAAGLLRFANVGAVNHASVIGIALGTVALTATVDELALAFVFVVLGIARGLVRVTSASMVAEERGRPGASIGMASAVYNAGLDAGGVLGPPLGGVLAGLLDIPTTFRVVALALVALYYGVWFAQARRAARRRPAPSVVPQARQERVH